MRLKKRHQTGKAELTTTSDATCLAKAIREAFESASFEDAKLILERAMRDHKDYF